MQVKKILILYTLSSIHSPNSSLFSLQAMARGAIKERAPTMAKVAENLVPLVHTCERVRAREGNEIDAQERATMKMGITHSENILV